MSIIYEALQKAQKTREANKTAPLLAKTNYQDLAIKMVSLIITLAILAGAGYGLSHFIPHKSPPKVPPPILAKPKPVVRVVKVKLNGVFLSNEEKIAMINQQMYRLGDNLYGMKIVRIELDKVWLKNNKQSLELRVS